MAMDKFIFKTKFRLSKIKAFFQLCKYTFIQKFNLAPDEGFALHLMTGNLRTLLRTSAEHEYLEVHGLLPEEEEEEAALEPEEAAEPEEGLLRELGFGMVMPICLKDGYYMATLIKEYEDRTCIEMDCTVGEYEYAHESICVPHEEGNRFDRFTLFGIDWRWDREDCVTRPYPQLPEDAKVDELMRGVWCLGGLVIRVEREFAEERLSPICLEYAFLKNEEYYEWCIADYSAYTVYRELDFSVEMRERYICSFCNRYWQQMNSSEN